MSDADLAAATPALVLAVTALVVVLLALPRRIDIRALAWVGAAGSAAAAAATIGIGPGPSGFATTVARDGASGFFGVLIATVSAAALVLAAGDPRPARRLNGEEVALVLFSACGATLMVAAADLVVLFSGIALLSLPLYVLTARRQRAAGYFLIAAAMSAVALYGVALLYTAVGETVYAGIGRATRNPLYLAGLALTLAGLAFHAALAPFHAWSAVAHEAVPPPVSALLGIVARVAAFGAILRLAAVTKSGEGGLDWEVSLATLAALSLIVAALLALTERRIDRLVAYAALSQAAFVAIAAAGFAGPAAAFALAVDAVLLLGLIGAVSLAATAEATLDDLAGLARQRPLVVLALGLVLLGLIGLPPMAGFLAKLYVFEAALRAQLLWLVVLGAFAGVLSAASYIRVLLACFAPPRLDAVAPPRARIAATVLVLAAASAVGVFIVPGPLLDAAQAVRF